MLNFGKLKRIVIIIKAKDCKIKIDREGENEEIFKD